jgi:AraC-like DNA-binding protein
MDPARVMHVKSLGGHRLRIEFPDGRSGEIDFAGDSFTGVLAPLRDPVYFGTVGVDEESGALTWPNGVDLDPLMIRCRALGEPLPEWAGEDRSGAPGGPQSMPPDVPAPGASASVPEISRFLGIVIRMFFSDHAHPHFHAIYGEGPRETLSRTRLHQASMLLENTTLSVGEVGAACGFENPCSFARAFRAHYGTTASGYRDVQRCA